MFTIPHYDVNKNDIPAAVTAAVRRQIIQPLTSTGVNIYIYIYIYIYIFEDH